MPFEMKCTWDEVHFSLRRLKNGMSDGAREKKFVEHRSQRDLFPRPTEFYYIRMCSLLIMKRLGTIIMSHLFTLIHSDDQL